MLSEMKSRRQIYNETKRQENQMKKIQNIKWFFTATLLNQTKSAARNDKSVSFIHFQ